MTDKRASHTPTIGIYSPSGSFSDAPDKVELFDKGVERLRADGFAVVESKHCRGSWFHASASPADRVSDLYQLCSDPAVDAIIPSIGGHVASQLLRHIDFERVAASGTKLFGFSDNSIIPLITTERTGVVTYHAACDVTFGFGRFAEGGFEIAERTFIAAVNDDPLDLSGRGGWRSIQSGTSSGTLLGGNLKGLASLAGTPWWPDWSGKVMFWESMDPLHVVAQNLTQLSNAGAFDNLAAMIIGRVDTLQDPFYGAGKVIPVDEFLLDVLDLRAQFPIIGNADIGHNVDNVTWPLGKTATVEVTDSTATCRLTD
ncbi:S66 peptidase family protein [Nocardia nova]|uniref:S66 peptidase family protein n=1 Tax=Nocardia nova TaxID=37330 RepID=UPI00273A2CF2|nr:LD-carboxypeptidase [Nocardia nova]